MKKLILFIITLFLCGCGNYAELNKLSIVTAVGIDKSNDGYELSFLIANAPKAETSSKEGEAKTTVYKGSGKTIPEAAQAIDQISPKRLYFGHINVVIISEDIAEEGFFKSADWLLRNPQTRKKFYLLQAKNVKAGNILKIVSPLESFPSQNIATLIESNQNSKSIATSVSYSTFIGTSLQQGLDPVLPSITIKGSVKKGSNEKNLETTTPESYLALGPLAIYRKDKLKGFVTKKESQSINILKNDTKELNYTIKYKGENISIDSRNLKTIIKYDGDNSFNINVYGKGNIYNVNGNINIKDYKVLENIENVWNKQAKKDLQRVILKMKKNYKTDIFGFGNIIYKNNPKKWNKIKSKWNDKYFPKINVKINCNLKISATGSLAKTIKEVAK